MTNYVSVPVPEHLVPAVMLLITDSLAKQPTRIQEVVTTDWTEPELQRMWDESGVPMRRTLVLLAQNAGLPVPMSQIAKTLGKPPKGHQVAGMMGAFGRRLKNRYNRTKWPFAVIQNAIGGYWEYVMAHDVAKIIMSFEWS
jgi:hypothetical protein